MEYKANYAIGDVIAYTEYGCDFDENYPALVTEVRFTKDGDKVIPVYICKTSRAGETFGVVDPENEYSSDGGQMVYTAVGKVGNINELKEDDIEI